MMSGSPVRPLIPTDPLRPTCVPYDPGEPPTHPPCFDRSSGVDFNRRRDAPSLVRTVGGSSGDGAVR